MRDDVAAFDVLVVPLRNVDRGTLAGHRPGAVPAVDLDRPQTPLRPLRQQLDLIADADGAAGGNPRDDRAVALRGERPLHRHAEDAVGPSWA